MGILFSDCRKRNRTADAIRMLERCIALETTYVPAYLELFKLHRGIKAGGIMKNAIKSNPADKELRLKFGYWLIENGKHFLFRYISIYVRLINLNFLLWKN